MTIGIFLKRAAKFSLLLIMLLLGLVYFATATLPGLRLTMSLLQKHLNSAGIHYRVSEIDGTLTHFTLKSLYIETDESLLAFSNARIRWRPWKQEFSDGHFLIDEVEVGHLILGLSHEEHTPESTSHKVTNTKAGKIPDIHITQAKLDRFTIREHAKDVVTFTDNTAGLAINDTHLTITDGQAHLSGINAALSGDFRFEDSAIRLHGLIDQSLPQYQLHQTVDITGKGAELDFTGDGELKLGHTDVSLSLYGKIKTSGIVFNMVDPSNKQLNMQFEWTPSNDWRANFALQDIDFGGILPIKQADLDLDIEASGNDQAYQVNVKSTLNSAPFYEFTLVEDMQSKDAQPEIVSMALHTPSEIWTLKQKVPLIFNSEQISLPKLCLNQSFATACIHANWKAPDTFKLSIITEALDWAVLNPFLAPVGLAGKGKISVWLDHNAAKTTGRISAEAKNILANVADQNFRLKHMLANVQLDQENAQATFDVKTDSQDSAHANVMIHKWKNGEDAGIQGQVDLTFVEINPLNLLLKGVYDLQGQTSANLNLSGTLKAPRYEGDFRLKRSELNLPQLGITLKDIDLDLKGEGSDKVGISGQANTGDGAVHIEGDAGLTLTDPTVNLKITADKATLLNLPSAKLTASTHLDYRRDKEKQSLNGTINILGGQIDGLTLQHRFIEAEDIVYVDNQDRVLHKIEALPFFYDLNIGVNTIQFRGFDVETDIHGKLHLINAPPQPSKANGTLNLINGTYDNYGHHFNITKGAVIFNQSPLSNPNLDVTAEYRLPTPNTDQNFDYIDITARVIGTPSRPKLILSSKPTLSQEDILSYIVIGQPLSQAGGDSESGPLSSAALNFALRGGSQTVLSNIRRDLGLNQLSIGQINGQDASQNPTDGGDQSEVTRDNTALFIGKAISPILYVSYGIGLFNHQQIFRTQIKLGRRWRLHTESSSLGNGADVIYLIERD